MKKLLTILIAIIAGFASMKAQPLQYFMQRSSVNIASMSEAQSLQMFLSGQHSFVGFEGAPKNVLLNVATPIIFKQRSSFYNRQKNEPSRHFIGGTIKHETYGAHTHFRGVFGYNYRFFVGEKANITFGLAAGANTINSDYGKWQSETAIYSKNETTFSYQFGVRFEADRLSVSLFNNDQEIAGEIVWGNLWNGTAASPSSYDNDDAEEKIWHGQIAALFKSNLETKTNTVRFSANAVYRDGLGFGISYQTEKDIAANVSLRISKSLRIGYAYQLLSLNKLAPKHEIGVRYRVGKGDKDL